MKCFSPINIKNPNYARSFGKETYYISVPCGKCTACLSNKRKEWLFRLKAEYEVCESAYFVTLTYDNDHLPSPGDNGKVIVQKFLKRLRQQCPYQNIRYFLVNELGEEFGRLHYHMILFNYKPCDNPKFSDIENGLKKAWQQGNVVVGTVTGASMNYVCKYCLQKVQEDEKGFFSYFHQGDLDWDCVGLLLKEFGIYSKYVMALWLLRVLCHRSCHVITLKRSLETLTVCIEDCSGKGIFNISKRSKRKSKSTCRMHINLDKNP